MLVSDARIRFTNHSAVSSVLILVLVDVGLGPSAAGASSYARRLVLILVLVDVGLGRSSKEIDLRVPLKQS